MKICVIESGSSIFNQKKKKKKKKKTKKNYNEFVKEEKKRIELSIEIT